jgi:hypothetical protein
MHRTSSCSQSTSQPDRHRSCPDRPFAVGDRNADGTGDGAGHREADGTRHRLRAALPRLRQTPLHHPRHRTDGWTRQKAETELDNVLADIRRGIWQPPQPVEPPPEPEPEPTFHEFASAWLAEAEPGLRPNTVLDYRWQLTHHLLPFFAKHRLTEITVAEVDRYRVAKVREGRLNATSINKTLTRLGQILDVAEERELISRNPMSVNRRRRKLKASASRPWSRAAHWALTSRSAPESGHPGKSLQPQKPLTSRQLHPWARLVSNQRPLACEAVSRVGRKA